MNFSFMTNEHPATGAGELSKPVFLFGENGFMISSLKYFVKINIFERGAKINDGCISLILFLI